MRRSVVLNITEREEEQETRILTYTNHNISNGINNKQLSLYKDLNYV